MGPKSSERKLSSTHGDCDPTHSTHLPADAREPPVASGSVPDPRSRTIGGGIDGHGQSETVSDVPDLEDPSNSTGQSISNKDRMDSTGPALPRNPRDASRDAGVSENILRGEGVLSRGGKQFVCVVCEKAFQNKSRLKRHGVIHTCEKPFACTECGKVFARKQNLRLHLLAHSKAEHSCDFCYKPFSVPSSLERHIMTVHLEVISFPCEICKKTFPTLSDMQLHKRVHIGEKPYECEVCNRKFSRDSYLNRHRRLIH